ncbi:uncharacterized protein [Parasteatoda tepidariorum]|uniref:uncharacterized protein isoform X2 n=1 Tax=Parasteatoda tepidariorum TaxID=114398 RepID=UPI00077FD628|nr:uncharacterized protein LOC107436127 isoform X2 [Parasteatoda tepidariorum]
MMSLNNIPNNISNVEETSPEKTATAPTIEPETPVKKGIKRGSLKSSGKKQKSNENDIMSKSKLRKFLRNTGQEYVTKKGKVVKAKIYDDKDCGCSRRCKTKITAVERQKCFDKFWKMGDFGKQNAYLSGLVTREAVKQHRPRLNCTNRGPKGVTYQYRVNVGRVSKQVCKKYFLQTYLVSDGRLSRALRKEENEKEPGEDLRGKKPPANKTSEEQLNRVRDHINKFPRYDSHYALNPKGKYLKSDLNVKKMYNMYVEQCTFNNTPYVKENIYRSVFKEEYSLTFLSPRRDPCSHVRSEGSRSQNNSPRKKVCKSHNNNNMVPEGGVRPLSPPQPPHAKFPAGHQSFCPTDIVKCTYNDMTALPQNMPQDKSCHMQCYNPCPDSLHCPVLPHNYFTTHEQSVHHSYPPAQTPNFFNL